MNTKTIVCLIVVTLSVMISSVVSQEIKSIAIEAKNANQMIQIENLGAQHMIYFYSMASGPGDGYLAFVSPTDRHREFINGLKQKGIRFELLSIDGIERDLRSHTTRASSRTAYDFGQYNDWMSIHHELDRIAKYHQNPVFKSEVVTIGRTYQQKQIKAIKIEPIGDQTNTKIVVLECGAHAREWSSPAFCMWTINHLLMESLTNQISSFKFIIVPLLNVDGYSYSWPNWDHKEFDETDENDTFGQEAVKSDAIRRLWRKNREVVLNDKKNWTGYPPYDSKLEAKRYCIGTDLNRNFETSSWCSLGSRLMKHQCMDTACGAQSFSAPENKALRDYLTPLKGRLFAYFAIHAFGGAIMNPKGWSKDPLPQQSEWNKILESAVGAIKAVNGVDFKSGIMNTVLYNGQSTEGDSMDWAFEKLDVKYPFHIEVRPIQRDLWDPFFKTQAEAFAYKNAGFMLPPDQLKPMAKETWAGIEAALLKMIGLDQPVAAGAMEDMEKATSTGLPTGVLSSFVTIIVILFGASLLRYI